MQWISSIVWKMLEIIAQYFRKMLEIHCIKNARKLKVDIWLVVDHTPHKIRKNGLNPPLDLENIPKYLTIELYYRNVL